MMEIVGPVAELGPPVVRLTGGVGRGYRTEATCTQSIDQLSASHGPMSHESRGTHV